MFLIKIFDPTAITPHTIGDSWAVYSPYGSNFYIPAYRSALMVLGMSFDVPKGFVAYFYTAEKYMDVLRVENQTVLPGVNDNMVG